MAKCPYSYPARSRAAMIDAMESVGGYYERPNRYPFAWNVKWPYMPNADSAAALEPFRYEEGEPFRPEWDSAWQAEMESEGFFGMVIESLREGVDCYSTWPGDDGGAYEFTFGGRSGGWMILESAHGIKLAGLDLDDLRDAEESGWSFAEVRRLYRAIMTMESDFSAENVRKAFLGELAFRRAEWEERRRAEIAELTAEAEGDKATALALIGELKAARLACPVAFPVICQTIRKAISNAIRDRRRALREAARLAGEESAVVRV